jgi:hypothetical protein
MGTLQLLKRTIVALVSACAFAVSPANANGFEDFDDAELIDHIAGSVARGYGRMHGYQVEFKLIGKEVPHQSPLMVKYNKRLKLCTFMISTRDKTWHSFEQYLEFFEDLPKQVVYEAFFAHESGHCVQMKENIDFGPHQRRHREELYADVFALSHVERYFPKNRKAFQEAQLKMRRAALGIQKDYDFYKELLRLHYSPGLQTALRVKNPQDRAFSIAKAVDLL